MARIPAAPAVCRQARTRSSDGRGLRCCARRAALLGPAEPQSPFARSALPLRPRYYGLMRRSFGLSRPSTHRASSGSLCSLGHPLLVRRTVPIWAYASLLECHAPYAGGMPGALGQYFPSINGLRLTTQGSAVRKSPHQRFPVGATFSTRQAFRNVVALQVARPPDRSAPLSAAPGDFYTRASCRVVTFPAVEHATRPTGQLPGLVFHQQEAQPSRPHVG